MSAVDPWFNFRATKYLVQHGFYSFWDWFDDRTQHLRIARIRQSEPTGHSGCIVGAQLTDQRVQEHGILSDVSLEAHSTPD